MAAHLEKQERQGEQVAQSLRGLPDTLQRVEKALEAAAATEQRTTATIGEVRQTMSRIQASMGQMVAHSKTQADASSRLAHAQSTDRQELAATLRETQQESVSALQRATTDRLDALRVAQDAHARRLGEIAQDTGRWRNAVIVLLALVFLALAGIGTLLALT